QSEGRSPGPGRSRSPSRQNGSWSSHPPPTCKGSARSRQPGTWKTQRSRSAAQPPNEQRAGSTNQATKRRHRSEEHTSELQSRENLVCRLLLEKKNRKKI